MVASPEEGKKYNITRSFHGRIFWDWGEFRDLSGAQYIMFRFSHFSMHWDSPCNRFSILLYSKTWSHGFCW